MTNLTIREYSAPCGPLNIQEVILKQVQKESWAISTTDYMPPVPRITIHKVKWAETVKRAFMNEVKYFTI